MTNPDPNAPEAAPAAPTDYPRKLADLVDVFRGMTDRTERINLLIDMGKSFKPVAPEVAERPFPERHRVPHCESEAFVFAEPRPDGTLKFHFAVENPQGMSAMAAAVILDKGLSGQPRASVAATPPDIMYEIFGRELSMGKNMGLTGMVNMCRTLAAAAPAASPAAGQVPAAEVAP